MICRGLDAAHRGTSPEPVYDRYRGWAAHEAIAAGMFAAARHSDDTRAGLLEAANTPGDSDSLASIAGALLGARNGAASLPADWVADLERTDDLQQFADGLASLAARDKESAG
jgi:ADP-ribosylglycohydrolase